MCGVRADRRLHRPAAPRGHAAATVTSREVAGRDTAPGGSEREGGSPFDTIDSDPPVTLIAMVQGRGAKRSCHDIVPGARPGQAPV